MKKISILYRILFLLLMLSVSAEAQVAPPAGWSDFQLGLVSDNTNIINVRMTKALGEGVKLSYRYAYVNNGVDPTSNALSWLFNEWGTDYSKNSAAMGLSPGYVIYMLQEEGGAVALKNNILNVTFMQKYFASIRTVAEKSKGYKTIFVIEPDTWGYFLQDALQNGTESDPRLIPASVNNLGVGYEYLVGLPNTLSGVAQAIIRTIKKYAPDSYSGLLMSFWSVNANGVTGPAVADGNKGMVYWNQGDVDYSSKKNADFTNQLLSTTERGDFIGVEKNGWSAGNWLVKQNRNDYYWNDIQNDKWVSWAKTLRQNVNLPLLGWQISIGHMGLPNTLNRYEDTFMPYFFTHTQQFIDAGFIGFLAGKGLADCTDFTNLNGNSVEVNGSAGDDGWFFEQLKAFDAGRPYLSDIVNPTISITSPSNNAGFATTSNIIINASTTGSITKVEFFQGTTKLGEDVSAPYSITWYTVQNGNYTLTAKATTSSGTVITSTGISIAVTTPVADLALNKPVTVSSLETTNFAGALAVDGNATTRWSSAFSDPQWISVDLGATYNITRVNIVWEGAFGKDYKIQFSTNASSWTDIKNVTGNTTLSNDLTGLSGSGRYVRIYGIARGTTYGYSIYALEVYGTTGTVNTLPGVTITSPTNGTTFTPPACIVINVNSVDNDGSIAKVEFFNGSVKIGEDISSPYSFSWCSVPTGAYNLTAKATDNLGATGVSTLVVVTMGSGNINPTINITSPVNSTNFTSPALIIMNATASDTNGSITKVDFYNGSTLLGTDTSTPFSFIWPNVTAGTYSLTAKATDNENGIGTSLSISITVTDGLDNCATIASYVTSGGNYLPGSIVKNTGSKYECKPWPYSGWCNGGASAYAPGTGTKWTDGCTLKGRCSTAARIELAGDNTTVDMKNDMILYPTHGLPNKEQILTLKFSKNPGNMLVYIFNANGTAIVNGGSYRDVKATLNVVVPPMIPGLYLVRVKSENTTWINKYIISH